LSPKLSPSDSLDGSHTPKSKNEQIGVIKSQSLEYEKTKKSLSPRSIGDKRSSGKRTLTPRNGSKCTSPETKSKTDLSLTLEPHELSSTKKRRKKSKISKKEEKKNGEAQDTEGHEDDDEDEDHDEDVNKQNGSDEE